MMPRVYRSSFKSPAQETEQDNSWVRKGRWSPKPFPQKRTGHQHCDCLQADSRRMEHRLRPCVHVGGDDASHRRGYPASPDHLPVPGRDSGSLGRAAAVRHADHVADQEEGRQLDVGVVRGQHVIDGLQCRPLIQKAAHPDQIRAGDGCAAASLGFSVLGLRFAPRKSSGCSGRRRLRRKEFRV